eukprot:SAG31_NODE_4730_length_2996_cov_1.399724_1_plen_251_part_00
MGTRNGAEQSVGTGCPDDISETRLSNIMREFGVRTSETFNRLSSRKSDHCCEGLNPLSNTPEEIQIDEHQVRIPQLSCGPNALAITSCVAEGWRRCSMCTSNADTIRCCDDGVAGPCMDDEKLRMLYQLHYHALTSCQLGAGTIQNQRHVCAIVRPMNWHRGRLYKTHRLLESARILIRWMSKFPWQIWHNCLRQLGCNDKSFITSERACRLLLQLWHKLQVRASFSILIPFVCKWLTLGTYNDVDEPDP